MTELRDLLVEVAGTARVYEVTDHALRVVGHRQLMARLIRIAAALLVVAGMVVISVWFGG